MAFDDSVKLIWSLASSGLGTTITGNGNSGTWSNANPNRMTPVDLRRVDDLTITAYVAGTVAGTNPSLTIQFGFYDDQGNLFQPTAFKFTAITAASTPTTAQFLAVGRHAGSAGTYIALPEWGQVSWTVTGSASPTFNGVEIALYAS